MTVSFLTMTTQSLHWGSIQWGNIPAGVSSVLTALSLLVAAVAYRRDRQEKGRAQASKVSILPSNRRDANLRIVVANRSDQAIYTVALWIGIQDDWRPRIASWQLPADTARMEELLPGQQPPGLHTVIILSYIGPGEDGTLSCVLRDDEDFVYSSSRSKRIRWRSKRSGAPSATLAREARIWLAVRFVDVDGRVWYRLPSNELRRNLPWKVGYVR